MPEPTCAAYLANSAASRQTSVCQPNHLCASKKNPLKHLTQSHRKLLARMPRHVFLTGAPGVGKTTLVQKAIDVLKSSAVLVDGFYTEEVRQCGKRIGFDVVTLSGRRGTLSRVGSDSHSGRGECRVGQYSVDLPSFEQVALPELRDVKTGPGVGGEKRVCVIDEIGKMELFSQPFVRLVREILDSECAAVLGTIPVPKGKPLILVEEIRQRGDVKVFSVTKENRNSLLQEIITTVDNCRK
ncbi:cancer-related nucleoside-triphosphatase isoform X2 [Ambystoma mexicanum]|uniref:cancer-related nucleoside-triphosphatase isoform X2 n=1 Tax=Ambystoma mexicanum TaxID=8296 RepID=UPI0037E8B5A1